jgi:hypothetical protein
VADNRVKDLIRQIQAWEGWRVEVTKSGWVAYPPSKAHRPIHIHKTPSDHRWHKNIVADLRRAGGQI